MRTTFLLVDTDFLMQYKPIQDIDWAEHLQVDHVTLVITPIVTRQLERHKTGDKRKRNRTIAATKLLEQLPDTSESVELSKGLSIRLVLKRYADRSLYDLTDSEDDELLLNAIHLSEDNLGSDVRILSGDKIFRIRMQEHGIKPVKPQDGWRLPPESDQQDKKVKELEKLALASPELSLAFIDGHAHRTLQLRYPPNSDQTVVGQIRKKAIDAAPLFQIASALTCSEDKRYSAKREILEYIDETYVPFVKDFLDCRQLQARSCGLELSIRLTNHIIG